MDADNASYRQLADMVDALQAKGRYTFDRSEAMAGLGADAVEVKNAARRLAAKQRIVAPLRGFYVIVPLEYRAAGSPPASWFIDDFMRHLGQAYYVGVLSAAALHGASHQQPQELQVVTHASRRAATAGKVRIRFLGKRHLDRTPTVGVDTETGTMRVSTPEATALDLLRYASLASGGLGNVATVLEDLAQQLRPEYLIAAARADGERSLIQRLGYLLERAGAREQADVLAAMLAKAKVRQTPLRPGRPVRGCAVSRRWRVILNEAIEVDL